MAKGPNQDQSLYGLPDPLTRAQLPPVVSKRSPLQSDTGFAIGQLWVNKALASAWILVQVSQGVATWQPILGGGAGVQTVNGFLSIASNFNFLNTCGLNIGGAPGIFSAGVNVDAPRIQCIANQITVQSASASPISVANLSGASHFDSKQFTVDANGFVQLAAAPTSFTWVSGNPGGVIAVNTGYIVTAGAPVWTLPAISAVGDQFAFILTENAGAAITFSIAIGAAQQVKAGNQVTSVGAGTKMVTNPAGVGTGQTLVAICTVANTNWQLLSSVGNYTLS